MMNLLIHDLEEKEFKKIAPNYDGWEIISDNGKIKPCVGCFGCWVKTPGECVIKDGYDKMGGLIHKADEVVVMSRYTYGGFSSFVKNVFDRSIGWVLPYFELYEGEMHHKKRYPEDKKLTFIFRGSGLTKEDKVRAKRYVQAVCRNFRGTLKDVIFEKCDAPKKGLLKVEPQETNGKTILLNCSLRGEKSNSKKFLDRLSLKINGETESINLSSYSGKTDDLISTLLRAEKIVLGMPLYVDGVPSQVHRIMEKMEQYESTIPHKIYVAANMGLYESRQLKNLLGMVKAWCDTCGYVYGGGLAIGAGEMIGMFMGSQSTAKGPAAKVSGGMDMLAGAINSSAAIEDIYAGPHRFPRALYMIAANSGWPRAGKKNGLTKKELLAQITV